MRVSDQQIRRTSIVCLFAEAFSTTELEQFSAINFPWIRGHVNWNESRRTAAFELYDTLAKHNLIGSFLKEKLIAERPNRRRQIEHVFRLLERPVPVPVHHNGSRPVVTLRRPEPARPRDIPRRKPRSGVAGKVFAYMSVSLGVCAMLIAIGYWHGQYGDDEESKITIIPPPIKPPPGSPGDGAPSVAGGPETAVVVGDPKPPPEPKWQVQRWSAKVSEKRAVKSAKDKDDEQLVKLGGTFVGLLGDFSSMQEATVVAKKIAHERNETTYVINTARWCPVKIERDNYTECFVWGVKTGQATTLPKQWSKYDDWPNSEVLKIDGTYFRIQGLSGDWASAVKANRRLDGELWRLDDKCNLREKKGFYTECRIDEAEPRFRRINP